MDLLIKGMKIPQSCYDCDMLELSGVVGCHHAYDSKNSNWGRALNCPLIELPDHGDLIDRDELMKHGVYMPREGGNLPIVYMSYVKAAKAVIPAERSEEEDGQFNSLQEFWMYGGFVMDDMISRQAAIDAILQRLDALKGLSFGTSTFRDGIADGYARIMSDLKALPSAQPETSRIENALHGKTAIE